VAVTVAATGEVVRVAEWEAAKGEAAKGGEV